MKTKLGNVEERKRYFSKAPFFTSFTEVKEVVLNQYSQETIVEDVDPILLDFCEEVCDPEPKVPREGKIGDWLEDAWDYAFGQPGWCVAASMAGEHNRPPRMTVDSEQEMEESIAQWEKFCARKGLAALEVQREDGGDISKFMVEGKLVCQLRNRHWKAEDTRRNGVRQMMAMAGLPNGGYEDP